MQHAIQIRFRFDVRRGSYYGIAGCGIYGARRFGTLMIRSETVCAGAVQGLVWVGVASSVERKVERYRSGTGTEAEVRARGEMEHSCVHNGRCIIGHRDVHAS